jgi:CBS-domain-containing membrane protein
VKVRDLMNEDVVTVAPETPLKDAAALLVEHRISGLRSVTPAAAWSASSPRRTSS